MNESDTNSWVVLKKHVNDDEQERHVAGQWQILISTNLTAIFVFVWQVSILVVTITWCSVVVSSCTEICISLHNSIRIRTQNICDTVLVFVDCGSVTFGIYILVVLESKNFIICYLYWWLNSHSMSVLVLLVAVFSCSCNIVAVIVVVRTS
jgi:hypothetical protein